MGAGVGIPFIRCGTAVLGDGVIRRGVVCQVGGVVVVSVSGVGVRQWVRNNSIRSQQNLNVFGLSDSGGNRGDGGGVGLGLVSGLWWALCCGNWQVGCGGIFFDVDKKLNIFVSFGQNRIVLGAMGRWSGDGGGVGGYIGGGRVVRRVSFAAIGGVGHGQS